MRSRLRDLLGRGEVPTRGVIILALVSPILIALGICTLLDAPTLVTCVTLIVVGALTGLVVGRLLARQTRR